MDRETHHQLSGLSGKRRIRGCAALRPGPVTDLATATKTAVRSLARRWLTRQAEIDDLDKHLASLVALPGVGVDTAGQLLVTAMPTAPRGASRWSACAATNQPRTTSPAEPPRARPRPRSCAA
ncbi:hypothetical protein ACFFMM_11820 [Micromonospora chaiyaphumensis]|uniref:hypothetical protein n=1 Tax=Micromonospora chaiyaphumensis TaxID=307119 RepID=UPI0011130A08|nr:hypothetical protein [Micromonospora chaiyaphumensis]